jgi:hypothetical protein
MATRPNSGKGSPAGAFLDLFEAIYVVNLDQRPDRLAEVSAELAAFGLAAGDDKVVRFAAVRPSDKGEFPSIGARGCFMSHLGVLEDAAVRGLDSVLILEDDVCFATDADHPALRDHEAWPPAFDILYGGHAALDRARLPTGGPLLRLPPDMGVMTTHCIGFRGPAITRAAEFLATLAARRGGDPEGGPMHVDGAYCWLRRLNPDVATFAVDPPIALQRPSRSDVSSLKWFDRAPVVRDVVAALRRMR